MSTKQMIQQKVEDIKATVSPYSQSEKWIDDNGNIYYIDRAPIDWSRVIKGVTYERNSDN
jgi:hypothetical protein